MPRIKKLKKEATELSVVDQERALLRDIIFNAFNEDGTFTGTNRFDRERIALVVTEIDRQIDAIRNEQEATKELDSE